MLSGVLMAVTEDDVFDVLPYDFVLVGVLGRWLYTYISVLMGLVWIAIGIGSIFG